MIPTDVTPVKPPVLVSEQASENRSPPENVKAFDHRTRRNVVDTVTTDLGEYKAPEEAEAPEREGDPPAEDRAVPEIQERRSEAGERV